MSLVTPPAPPARGPEVDLDARLADLLADRRRLLDRATGETTPAPAVAESWRRSLRYGLQPDRISPVTSHRDPSTSRLLHVVEAAVGARRATIHGSHVCLALTDPDGVVLQVWSGAPQVASKLESLDISPGFQVDETIIGTTSGSSLINRAPTYVRGAEHFAEQFLQFTSAGMVIVHPVSRRVAGSLNLICDVKDTSPLALPWITELVTDIERRLLHATSVAEQSLWRAFLDENRDARHPVVGVNVDTVVANAAATRLLGVIDQAMLWEHAAGVLAAPDTDRFRIGLPDGSTVEVDPEVVPGHDDQPSGVLMRLTRQEAAGRRPVEAVESLSGLAGAGPRWTALRRQLATAHGASLLLVGPPGSGKSAVASAVAGDGAVTIDVDAPPATWSALLEAEVASPATTPLVLRHVDHVPAELRSRVAALLRNAAPRRRIIGTTRTSPATGSLGDDLRDAFLAVVTVPSLDERPEDLAAIVACLTSRHRPDEVPPMWMPDAIQTLARAPMPENVRSLEQLVVHVLAGARQRYIGAADLPSGVRTRASRRRLSGLQRMEADAIVQALSDADGNKLAAAEALGIARSTLYRKMRALGLEQ